MTPSAGAMPGLDQLIARLRQAPLQVPIGASEAIDAARLLAHHARQAGPADPVDLSLQTLRLRLRPVLCKAAGDLPHFDEAFDAWWRDGQAVNDQPGDAPPPSLPPTPPSPATTARSGGTAQSAAARRQAAASAAAKANPADPAFWRQPWFRLLFGVLLLAAVLVVVNAWWPDWSRPDPTPADVLETPAASAPVLAPSAPQAAVPAAPSRDTGPAIRGFTPDWHASETLRWPWLALLLGLPLLGLLPLLGAPPPLPYISRQRGAGNLTLEAWPPHKQRRQLVRDIAPATSGQLQRHVRGAVDQREAYARRPLLDMRRTVNASLARGGLLQLHYRFARLRPAYLVLVHAQQDDDLGVLWARRLADLDVRAAIFRFHPAAGEADPPCVEVGGLARRLPFTALPAPWPEQRLVVIGRCSVLVTADGQLHGWVRRARLGRWAQRVLFNPDEPRDWPRRQVQALESTRDGGLGMQVLPFEDNALDAWSDWLVRGELPPITLEAPQLYPRLLKDNEARFCGDTQPADLHSDPAQAEKLAQQIVTQLQAYLGQNGFYWLCACAVPPLLEQRLAQLLGEEYFRRCGASEARVAAYMARNWRLLVRLPWLRAQPLAMPQWLRLALLARLPPAIQDELREVVRGALGRRAAARRPGDGLTLAFDAPGAATDPRASRVDDPRHALMVGFVQDGLDARALMLRLPGAWQQWLPALRRRRGPAAGLAALQGGWRRLQRTDAGARAAALRWAVAGVLLSASALVALPTIPTSTWPDSLRALVFVKQAREPWLYSREQTVAVDSAGRWLAEGSGDTFLVNDLASHQLLSFQLLKQPVTSARFSTDGTRLVTVQDDQAVRVWQAPGLIARAHHSRRLANPQSPREVMPNRDGSRLLMMQAANPPATSDALAVVDALSGETLTLVRQGNLPVAFAWSANDQTLVAVVRRSDGHALEAYDATTGMPVPITAPPGSLDNFVALSPDGARWLTQTPEGLRLRSRRVGDGSGAVPVTQQPVRRATFNADGRRLLVELAGGSAQLLRATEQPARDASRPSDLPPDTVFLPDRFDANWGSLTWIADQAVLRWAGGGVLGVALLAALGLSARAGRRSMASRQVAR